TDPEHLLQRKRARRLPPRRSARLFSPHQNGRPGAGEFLRRASPLKAEITKRTKKYASATIRLFIKLPKTREEVRILGKQLLRSGTSVAAHVREASRARSDMEFVSKLAGALQEAD